MESISFLADENLIARIKRHYDSQKVESDSFDFEAKTVSCTITIYNNEVCFQGVDALTHASLWSKKHKMLSQNNENNEYVAVATQGDEDLFGPVVAVACYLDEEASKYIQSLEIPEHLTIKEIIHFTKELSNRITHTTTLIDNSHYNKLAESITKNSIRSRVINDAIVKMVKETGKTKIPYLLDNIIPKKTHINYLKDVPNRFKDVKVIEDYKSYDAYKVADLFAQYFYLSYLSKMQKSLNTKIPRGTQSDATQTAISLAKKYGSSVLSKTIKTNFANMTTINKNI